MLEPQSTNRLILKQAFGEGFEILIMGEDEQDLAEIRIPDLRTAEIVFSLDHPQVFVPVPPLGSPSLWQIDADELQRLLEDLRAYPHIPLEGLLPELNGIPRDFESAADLWSSPRPSLPNPSEPASHSTPTSPGTLEDASAVPRPTAQPTFSPLRATLDAHPQSDLESLDGVLEDPVTLEVIVRRVGEQDDAIRDVEVTFDASLRPSEDSISARVETMRRATSAVFTTAASPGVYLTKRTPSRHRYSILSYVQVCLTGSASPGPLNLALAPGGLTWKEQAHRYESKAMPTRSDWTLDVSQRDRKAATYCLTINGLVRTGSLQTS
jgi:hypothetical protein